MTVKRRAPGTGGVKTLVNRANQIVGYRALLPRELSRPPEGCKNPEKYQEPFGEICSTWEDASKLLDAVLPTLRANPLLGRGPSVIDYVRDEIQARHQEARRKYDTAARANRAVSTWRSIDRRWLSEAPFAQRSPHTTTEHDLQPWFDYLRDEAEGASGEPLSGDFIRNVGVLLKASFARVVGIERNPCLALKLPPKNTPRVPFLAFEAQRVLFGAPSEKVPARDRVMIGCGMGAGLRVGELLPFEPSDVHLEGPAPHLMVRYGGPDHAPTKSRRVRRVELHEPGLGFWRIWMAQCYRPGDRLVFEGPRGGYQKSWAEGFKHWAERLGLEHISSHIMRHTYAVAMLSGTWGYEPRSLDFISQQLGHGDRQTTERFYKGFEAGVWTREVQRMTGSTTVSRGPVTATELLLSRGGDAAADSASTDFPLDLASGAEPRHSPQLPQLADKTEQADAGPEASPQSLARQYLEAVALGDPRAVAIGTALATLVLAADEGDEVADVG